MGRLNFPNNIPNEAQRIQRWNDENAARMGGENFTDFPDAASSSAKTRSFARLPTQTPSSTENPSLLTRLVEPPQIFEKIGLAEIQREPAYRDDLLALYRSRLRLLAIVAMLTLPSCAAAYALLIPGTLRRIMPVYALLFLLAIGLHFVVGRLNSLRALRVATLCSYAVFSAGASVVIALLGDHNPLLYGSHTHIMLSALLLPFTVWEGSVIAVIVVGSLAWAGWWSLPQDQTPVYISYLYLLGTTALFVLGVTHFQSVLRRRAFDAAFDLMRSNEKLQAISFLDTLTGGFNRRYLESTLAVEIARSVRFDRSLSVMMFDLDNFKQVNDTRGHAAGDEVLREVWQAILTALREVDTAARYGGDEFSAILPETDEDSALGVAERLQSSVRFRLHNRFGADSVEGRVTLSIGIVTTHPSQPHTEIITPDRLIDAADERLYEAKRRGKNSVVA
ncbi:MAG TPA: GGDEF domain-containing protein [Abditibacteriaceae bacterium]|jgi:diguanylate cyclase (GGDEF)-like protein